MKNLARLIQFVAQYVTLGLALAFVVSLVAPRWTERLRGTSAGTPPPAAAQGESARPPATKPVVRSPGPGVAFGPASATSAVQPDAGSITASYSSAVEAASPAVVSIFVNKIEQQTRQVLVRTDNPNLPPVVPAKVVTNVPTQNLGSGVIVNSDGYVLTNHHVVERATNISVGMPDGRSMPAKVIGSDKETDLAVLKLDVWNVATIPIAKRPAVVGDIVLAIGNPFGLDKTVTMGIVSAVGRIIHPETGEDFIQTDAAINSGNSGGALVNAYGELVGINSDTLPSANGGNVGISFAIPVERAKKVLDQIIRYGRVIRAWIGVTCRDAPSQSGDPMPVVTGGAFVTEVAADSPAAKVGLTTGDVITRIDDQWVPNALALRNRETHLAPGTKVGVTVLRGGKQLQFNVELAERPQPPAQIGQDAGPQAGN
ncbi:MAG: trypsin-like peptidase domain-containing protein [Proteobacteria bacterium]|uniref:trypsin-like peptidase domain-containing protein n=1 Tax=Rudaea sp. TaxID=2136325 RepID=UPI0037834447|nr:trypsin-like peptidase domain-containing protein [Pseudomonadota bacterium]